MLENEDKEKTAGCGYCQDCMGVLEGVAYRECPLCKQWYGLSGPCTNKEVDDFKNSKKAAKGS